MACVRKRRGGGDGDIAVDIVLQRFEMKGEKREKTYLAGTKHSGKVMAIAGRKSEGAWGYGPNGRGPRSQRGGQYDGVGNVVSHFPRSTLVFVQTVQTVSPRPPCSPLLSVLALFFLFSLSSKLVSCNVIVVAASTSPHPHTGDIPLAPPQHHNYCTNLMAATTAATSPFAGSQVPAALALTCVAGTHKPPCRRRPHCA